MGELAELVGFRLNTPAKATDDAASSPHQRIADQLADLIVRRQAAFADAGRD